MAMLRFFERIDALEARVEKLEMEQEELVVLLCEQVEANVRAPERLLEALRFRQALRDSAKEK